jgi:aminoglycoside phosphotransferase (APT) family kinase protein
MNPWQLQSGIQVADQTTVAHELRATTPAAYPRVTLVHGDAKPGNFAFVGDDVSAVFDWEMTTVGHPPAFMTAKVIWVCESGSALLMSPMRRLASMAVRSRRR